jgi:hypothetical protein
VGETRREERSGFARLLFLLCLHRCRIPGAVRARSFKIAEAGFPFGASIGGRLLVAREVSGCQVYPVASSSASLSHLLSRWS